MKALSYKESIPLIHALRNGAITTGLLNALEIFGEADSKPQNLCARSIFQNLSDGVDYQTSFLDADPVLPDPQNRIIVAGYQNSVIDYALDEVYNVLVDSNGHDNIFGKLLLLAEKYERKSSSIICQGCFEREFSKLLSRAKTEKANIVELEQIGESFLCQYYKSTKIIQIKEPTHSLVYKTLLQKLVSACDNNGILRTENLAYQIKQTKLASFMISLDNKDILKICFKGQK